MSQTVYDKRTLIKRVRRIRGQIEGIEKALNDEKDCSLILKDLSKVCKFINGSFNDVVYPDDAAKLKALFTEMIHWDRKLYEVIEKTSNWLENISREVFSLIEAGRLEEANILISDSRKALRQIKSELKQTTMSCFFSTQDIHLGSISNKGLKVN